MKLGNELKCALKHVQQLRAAADNHFSLTESPWSLCSLEHLGSLVTRNLEASVSFYID